MSWYDEAFFYHIYPLGLLGAPKINDYGETVHRLRELDPWIAHMKEMGASGLYIGPLFESVGHGYETTDYKKVDRRLGDNDDLKDFVAKCHEAGIRVVLDGVFNHTGRDFFAFKDIKEKRENSQYIDWYRNVNFHGNNEYNDGFSYDNWGGYNLLVKLNQRNPQVQEYICNVIQFWRDEFAIDGIRLDAADVLDFGFMERLRRKADEMDCDFWLLGEVIHGEYSRWVNAHTLHCVTNYALYKALYSGHNDHNYFEIAHTIKRLGDMGTMRLYNFVDNHDVERIYSRLRNKAHFVPVHVLLFALPGMPSIYYGSEFAIEGKKQRHSDDSLRPMVNLDDYADNVYCKLITALGMARKETLALSYGSYRELYLSTKQYAFARELDGNCVVAAVNNESRDVDIKIHGIQDGVYTGVLSGDSFEVKKTQATIRLRADGGDIYIPEGIVFDRPAPVQLPAVEKQKEELDIDEVIAKANTVSKPYEEMTVEELQNAILAKMAKNGALTDRMRQDVAQNTHRGSLLNWVRSFR